MRPAVAALRKVRRDGNGMFLRFTVYTRKQLVEMALQMTRGKCDSFLPISPPDIDPNASPQQDLLKKGRRMRPDCY
jgi:hypothetical protein